MAEHWKVRVKEDVTYKISYSGKYWGAGEEFVMLTTAEKLANHPALEAVEQVEIKMEASAEPVQKEAPAPPTGNANPAPPAAEKKIVATPEGTELVGTFEGVPSPAAIKAMVRETETSKTTVVEDESVGAAAPARFAKNDKGRGWFEVVDTETGEVVSDKSLREAEADQLVTRLIEAAASAQE